MWNTEVYKGHLLAQIAGSERTFILAPHPDAILVARPNLYEARDFVDIWTDKVYQVAVNLGRPKRKSKPYAHGDQERAEDGYFYGPETAIILSYRSDLDLRIGEFVLVPVGNHVTPRRGIVVARSSEYDGDLKEIYGRD